jgi:CelD/BcsL family acetyltransferase involved in cellulose biosynthesis
MSASPPPEEILLTPLRTPEDWRLARPEVDAFAAQCPPAPWLNRVHCESLHTLFWPGATVWWLRIQSEGADIGMMFLKEERAGSGLRACRVLRSLDAMTLQTGSLWAPAGMETRAARALLRHLGRVARETGADLIRLYRQEEAMARLIADAAEHAGRRAEIGLFTMGQRIHLEDDLDAYLARVGSKRVRDIRRRARKMAAELGAEPVLARHRGDLFARPGFDAVWSRYESLRRESWQIRELDRSGSADPAAVESHLRALSGHWSALGRLELVEYLLGGELLAAHLNVVMPDRVWMIVMNHDPRWRLYGTGMQLLLHMLETGHALGDRLHELGGEANDWKRDWATGEVPIHEITLPLDSVRARVWSLANRLGARRKAPGAG